MTAVSTTLYGAYSAASSAATAASTASANSTVQVSAPEGGFATFTVPADSADVIASSTGSAAPSAFTGAANHLAEQSALAMVLAGLVAVFFA